jgi:Family of unknown function (DUF6328)
MTPPREPTNDPDDDQEDDRDYDREESESEKLDRNWDELLQELRITQTGLQLLSGFLLTLPFTQVFPSLDHWQKAIYLGLVVVAGLAVGVNMTPVMLHRRVFRERQKDRVVAVGHVLIQVVMAAVALLIVGMSVLIFSVVATWTAGLLAGVGLAVALGLLLGVVPRSMEQR